MEKQVEGTPIIYAFLDLQFQHGSGPSAFDPSLSPGYLYLQMSQHHQMKTLHDLVTVLVLSSYQEMVPQVPTM
jgi:hypothetical protein